MKKVVTLTALFSACLFFASTLWSGQAASEPSQASGAAVYNQHCVKCHGAGGKGVENFTPDLASSAHKSQWLAIINDGRGAMPGFKDSLSSAQVKAVLKHINSFGAKGKKK